MKKIISLLMLLGLATHLVHAQFVYDYLKAGNDYFVKADYASAAAYYEKYLGNDKHGATGGAEYDPYKPQLPNVKKDKAATSKEKAQWQLAESYRMLHYPSKAADAYKKLLEANTAQFPLAMFHLAEQLRALGKYEEASTAFTAFISVYANHDAYKTTAEREIRNLQFIQQELSKPGLQYFTVQPATDVLTSPGANYAPVWVDSTTLLFTSTRPQDSTAAAHHTNKLYQVQFANGNAAAITAPAIAQSKAFEQGVATVSANGTTMYFTRWNATGTRNAALYMASKQGGKWSDPVALPADINQPGFSAQQPFITRDGHYLLFSSNKPGGEGGYDIWYAPVDETGKTGTPVNAGSLINTADDEQAPFYYAASGTLVFASNGRVGMGGFDLFSTTGEIGHFAAPENMGYPVNSVKDDIYLTARGNSEDLLQEVWLSSDRAAACCLELFRISRKLPAPERPAPPVQEPVVVAAPVPDTAETKTLDNVYYAYDKAELLDGSEVSLNKLIDMLNQNQNMVIQISGHTDGKGSEAYNLRLSLARAQKCVDYIVSKGIDASRITAKGYGATMPVAPNTNADGSDNPEGRKLNRRTTFTILKR
ncbi:OmpA family protein [Deminuibacter soli]|nr:OmpA family protein [Deminuibacter soli]